MERINIIKKLLSLKPQKIEYFNYFTSLTDAELERLVSKKTK